MTNHLTLTFIPSKKKTSLLKELEQVWEQTGVKPAKLEELQADIPQSGKDLWDFFWEVKQQETLSWQEIMAFCGYYGLDLSPPEIQIIFAMNSAYNKYINNVELDNKPKGNGKAPKKNSKKSK